jgi:pimeloyl-ACP methyl ester carboxylesterase
MNATLPAGAILGFRSETVSVNGIRLHYWIGGDPDGQPAILWHGFLSTGFAWRDVAPALAEAGLAVLVPDMRGFGDSDKPGGDDGYDARALAEECRALVAQLGFGRGRPLLLAAHDMGALPALIWAADHEKEVSGLLYVEAPVMLGEALRKSFEYRPETMAGGSMWWWLLPLAPGVPEALVVGHERAFLDWFYQGAATVRHEAFTPAVIDEYLRTFVGREGVLGSMGIYRAAFMSIDQTEPLMRRRLTVPVVALGGASGLGAKVGEMVKMVAEHVDANVLEDCGHFVPEERPDELTRHILAFARRVSS